MIRPRRLEVVGTLWIVTFIVAAPLSAEEPPVDYNRDIRPILSNTCYTCHGPDEATRKADLRLDTQEGLLSKLESGRVIVPGKSAESLVYERISSDDESIRMPPQGHDKQLTPRQIELIRKWIDQGAEWQGHWSFITPQRPALPELRNSAGVVNPIDLFIRKRLEDEGLTPSPEADKVTLIRRVTLDLTGLPPTIAEIDAFLADNSPNAYEKLVDRLLDSPRYGEQMARYWLDAARYGDTHGLHLDNERSMWPYRDWVINAFNRNMPFDRFTIEQLAGDLLPEPTKDQLVATGFNRCNVTTSEGGSIAEEYLVRYAVDRVETTSTVWMGLTTGCAVCHDHKFDPISQKEFFQLFGYFFSLTENAMDGNALAPPPIIRLPTDEQAAKEKQLQAEVAGVEKAIRDELAKIDYQEPAGTSEQERTTPAEFVWIDDALPPGATPDSPASWKFVGSPDHPVLSGSKSHTRTGEGLSQHYFTGANPGLKIGPGDKLFAYVYIDPKNPPQEVMLQFNDGNWEHRAFWGQDVIPWGQPTSPGRVAMGLLPEAGQWVRLEVEAEKVGLKPGSQINGWAFTQHGGTVYWDRAGIVTLTPQEGAKFDSLLAWETLQKKVKDKAVPKPVHDAIAVGPDKRTEQQQKLIRDYFVEHVYSETREIFAPLHQRQTALKNDLTQLDKEIPKSLIMQDMPQRREAHILIRGEYDKKGEKVDLGVPAALPPLPPDAPPNRLALARWLVDPAHPLTARVTVNRFWQRYFGTGIVATAEDFGAQGEWPSHPRLLDWLATEFIETGWNVKQMQKLMVMSATYRQSSRVTREHLEKDPANRLLARGPRFRMDAEMIRDHALYVSGLLLEEIGGKSVKPYQPAGLWEAVGYTDSNTARFVQDHGEALYRRSMYTFWKRTAPPPSMLTFDAPSRESCTVRRARTNTPMQALALMNDTQFVEAAWHFGQRIMKEGGTTPDERIVYAFRAATAREPNAEQLQVVRKVYEATLAAYRSDQDAALKLISVGESKRDESLDPGELAAWTMVANLILNLNETITKG